MAALALIAATLAYCADAAATAGDQKKPDAPAAREPPYTEYAGVGHASWVRAFAEPELLKWVFARRRGVPGP